MIKAEADIKEYGTFSNGTWSNVKIQIKYPLALPDGTYQNSTTNPVLSGDYIVCNNGFVWKIISYVKFSTDIYICSLVEQSVSVPLITMFPDNLIDKGLIVSPNNKGLLSPYYHDSYVSTNSFRAAMSYNMKIHGTSSGSGGTSTNIPTSLVLGSNSKIYGGQLLFIVDSSDYTWMLGTPYYDYSHPYRQKTYNYSIIKDTATNQTYKLKDIAGGYTASFSISSETNKIYTWGSNELGRCGLGHSNIIGSGIYEIKSNQTFKKVSTAFNNSIAIDTDNYIWYMGELTNFQIKEFVQYNSIFNRYPYIDVCAIDTGCCMIANDGSLWTIGSNGDGQLGIGSTITSSTTPVKVASSNIFKKVFGYNRIFYAIDSQDYLWAWGADLHYIFEGLGNTTRKSIVPVKISNVLKFNKIVCGMRHCIALTTDGDVYGWGDCSYGQLGNGITTGRSSIPIRANIGKCIDVAICTVSGNIADDYAEPSYAIDINYRLWGWGKNGYRYNGATPYPYYFGPNNKANIQLTSPTLLL